MPWLCNGLAGMLTLDVTAWPSVFVYKLAHTGLALPQFHGPKPDNNPKSSQFPCFEHLPM